ncbi:MAG: glycosyltransferase family 1 protein [Cytophagales bacterium]
MKEIAFVFRDPRTGNYSIEELFKRIINGLDEKVTAKEFTCGHSKLASLREIQKINADVFHITGDVNYMSLALPKKKTLITVHDIGHFENTLKGWKKSVYKTIWMDLPFSRCQHMTTISNFTKERLVTQLKINPDKISVIHNPKPDFSSSSLPEMTGKFKIMQIGSGRNKNLQNLIEASKGIDGLELVLVRKFDELIEQKLNDYKISHTWKSNLNYDEVEATYHECHALFFASDYEGFGLPIIEAQCVGRPVITSNVASMPEVAADAALFVDHNSISDIKSAIILLQNNQKLREDLIKKGLENVKRFEFSSICESYFQIYEKIF